VIRETVQKVIVYGKAQNFPFEIIVVNDGSHDQTQRNVEQLQKLYQEIHLINHKQNRGYGEALRSGFNAAKMDWIFLMDSDGQFDISQLDIFLPHTPTHDMLLGYRVHRADTTIRVILGWGYTVFMNFLFGLQFKDIDCAFKLFRKTVWQKVQPITSKDHKIFSVELLWNAKRANLRIKELPVSHYPRLKGTSTGARLDIIWQMVKSLIKLRFR